MTRHCHIPTHHPDCTPHLAMLQRYRNIAYNRGWYAQTHGPTTQRANIADAITTIYLGMVTKTMTTPYTTTGAHQLNPREDNT